MSFKSRTEIALLAFLAGMAIAWAFAARLAGHPAVIGSAATLAVEAAAFTLCRAFRRTRTRRTTPRRPTVPARAKSPLERDLAAALANFGSPRAEAKAWAAEAVDRVGADADFATAFKAALKTRTQVEFGL